ncbi:MAG: VIT1/CCC1 transporter family protein [Actinomycetota bacterium]|nr:VIT1/CCC1 transporter family protein [Actinomycetota bacterium]
MAALMEKLGLGGREMTSSGHSKDFVLKVVQPSLVGLMDGSVSTLAPLFATAFATGDTRITFLVGLAAAVGAAISMAFSEGLSDDGTLTGRGNPILRGSITGVATFIGGILHTLPFLLPQVGMALYVAFGVVGVELLAISFIRYRYFQMSFLVSALQVILGGALVFASGILIGSA